MTETKLRPSMMQFRKLHYTQGSVASFLFISNSVACLGRPQEGIYKALMLHGAVVAGVVAIVFEDGCWICVPSLIYQFSPVSIDMSSKASKPVMSG